MVRSRPRKVVRASAAGSRCGRDGGGEGQSRDLRIAPPAQGGGSPATVKLARREGRRWPESPLHTHPPPSGPAPPSVAASNAAPLRRAHLGDRHLGPGSPPAGGDARAGRSIEHGEGAVHRARAGAEASDCPPARAPAGIEAGVERHVGQPRRRGGLDRLDLERHFASRWPSTSSRTTWGPDEAAARPRIPQRSTDLPTGRSRS